MLGRLVLAGLLATSAEAFAPAPVRIQWGSRRFVLAPRSLPSISSIPSKASASPQVLMVTDGSSKTSPNEIPHFTLKSDGEITWDSLCWQASGDKRGDVIHVSHCTGGKSQLWNVLPERNQIQLQGTKMCVGMNMEGGLNGAAADLQECDDDRSSKSWKFETPASSRKSPSRNTAPSSSMRFDVLAFLGMAGLGSLSLSVWLWRWRTSFRVATMRQDRLPLDIAQEGVSLCAPFIVCHGNAMLAPRFDMSAQAVVPAVMATSPIAAHLVSNESVVSQLGEGLDALNTLSEEELDALVKSFSEEVQEVPEELDPTKVEKAMKGMVAFSNTYSKRTGTTFCSQREIPAVVIRGLAENKIRLGAPLCPCRNYEDEKAEVKKGHWNCPCEPMRTHNDCHCMLFLEEDHECAGGNEKLTLDEVKELANVS